MTKEELLKKLQEIEENWKQTEEALNNQFRMELGAYHGRKSVYEEMLKEFEEEPVDEEVFDEED